MLVYKNKEQEVREILEFRKEMGFPIIRTGFRECLKCECNFFSRDLNKIKICDICKWKTEENSGYIPDNKKSKVMSRTKQRELYNETKNQDRTG